MSGCDTERPGATRGDDVRIIGLFDRRLPLLQRDYWAVIAGCRLTPEEVMEVVASRFCELPPENLVRFQRRGGPGEPLCIGEELDISIRMAGEACVRVIHMDACSLTLETRRPHPEQGRITFGAYRNGRSDVIFHIRSRARSRSEGSYMGFLLAGEAMQTNTWTEFVDRVAHTVGDGVLGVIHAETQELPDAEPDAQDPGPTFVAREAE